MTAINLDDQLVGTAYNTVTRACSYTYQHTDGSRYTVTIPIEDLHRIGTTPATLQQRRNFVATKIVNYIQTNPPDDVDVRPPA